MQHPTLNVSNVIPLNSEAPSGGTGERQNPITLRSLSGTARHMERPPEPALMRQPAHSTTSIRIVQKATRPTSKLNSLTLSWTRGKSQKPETCQKKRQETAAHRMHVQKVNHKNSSAPTDEFDAQLWIRSIVFNLVNQLQGCLRTECVLQ